MNSAVSKKLICSIVILVVSYAATIPARSEIVAGVATVYVGWDFSTQTSIDCTFLPQAGCDIAIDYIVDPPLGLYVSGVYTATIAMLEDVAFEEMEEAPSDETMYQYLHPARLGVTYVVQTNEGHFAKFRFTALPPFVVDVQIEYVYQSDGSRNFVDAVPVERSTWGAVKALYTIR